MFIRHAMPVSRITYSTPKSNRTSYRTSALRELEPSKIERISKNMKICIKRVFAKRAMAMLFALSLLLSGTGALAQTSTTGTIEGVVTDANGAVVPGVTVTVTSPNLMRAQTAVTDSEGRYRIPNLPPGKYAVSIESAKGFAKFD